MNKPTVNSCTIKKLNRAQSQWIVVALILSLGCIKMVNVLIEEKMNLNLSTPSYPKLTKNLILLRLKQSKNENHFIHLNSTNKKKQLSTKIATKKI